MGKLNRYPARAALSLLLTMIVMLSSATAMSATAAPPITIEEMTIKSTSIVEPPATKSRLFIVNFKAVTVTTGAQGNLFLYDYARSVVLVGSIKVMTNIANGHHFEGCGFAFGGVSGYVCFQGAGQARPSGADYDLFSLFISNGGNYSVSGQLPPGSIDED